MIDKSERTVFTITAIVIMLFVFSLVYAKTTRKIDLPECLPYDKAYETPAVKQIDDSLYQVVCCGEGCGSLNQLKYIFLLAARSIFFLLQKM
jgi:hypothetical protein